MRIFKVILSPFYCIKLPQCFTFLKLRCNLHSVKYVNLSVNSNGFHKFTFYICDPDQDIDRMCHP